MQLVLSGNRIIAHGENFLAMGGVVINTETGDRYENATVAECDGCPSDIDTVGYEYHAGTFVPCAPYGKSDGNGYFMEVCTTCATPRNSGIPIKGGLKPQNLHPEVFANLLKHELLWENASPEAMFEFQTIPLSLDGYIGLVVEISDGQMVFMGNYAGSDVKFDGVGINDDGDLYTSPRHLVIDRNRNGLKYNSTTTISELHKQKIKPLKIYGVKL